MDPRTAYANQQAQKQNRAQAQFVPGMAAGEPMLPQSEVDTQMNRYRVALQELGDTFVNYDSRLQSVLEPQQQYGQQTSDCMPESLPVSPLVNDLRAANDLLELITAQFRGMMNRLQL